MSNRCEWADQLSVSTDLVAIHEGAEPFVDPKVFRKF